MSGLEEAVKGALGEGAARAAVTAADIVGAAVDDLCQNYENNVVSVFRPGSKNPTSDYDMMVVMKDGINIQEVSERIKKQLSMYSKEKAFKDVHFFVHRRSDYEDAHDFRPPEVVEPASIENWRGLAPTYQFAWEMRTTNPETDVYAGDAGKKFVAEQKPKAVNLHANRGEGLELVLTQTRCMLGALEKNSDAAIAKSVLRASAGIYLALKGRVMVTNEELNEAGMFNEAPALKELYHLAKEIRENKTGSFGKDEVREAGLFHLFSTAMDATGKLAFERPDYVWSKKRKERMEDYYAHNTKELIDLIERHKSNDGLPLMRFSADALLWYVRNGKDNSHKKIAKDLLSKIAKDMTTIGTPDFNPAQQSVMYWVNMSSKSESAASITYTLGAFGRIKRIGGSMPVSRENADKLRKFYLGTRAKAASQHLLLARICLALEDYGAAKKEYECFEKIKTAPHGFNPDLSEIKARILRQQGAYAESIQEDPTNTETWKEWSDAAPEPEKERYSAIASALERNDLASLVFGVHGEAAKKALLKPWQKKLIRDSKDVHTLAERIRTDCWDDANVLEADFSPNHELETMITLCKESALLAESFARQLRDFEKRVQTNEFLKAEERWLQKTASEFLHRIDLNEAQYLAAAVRQSKQGEAEAGPEMLELASTSAKRSALHFSYASIATAALAGASLTSFVPGSLQLYLQGATAIALPVLLATSAYFMADMALPRTIVMLKKRFVR